MTHYGEVFFFAGFPERAKWERVLGDRGAYLAGD